MRLTAPGLAIWLALSTPPLLAERPDDADALAGVSTGKVVFDINVTSASKLALYLPVIAETLQDLRRQGVEPDIILAFRGRSVLYITKDLEKVELSEHDTVAQIATQLAELRTEGVRMEACSVATRLFGADNTTLLDGVKPVGNTFVSLTGYNAQGYASIPIY